MTPYRKTAALIGGLFIIGTVAGILAGLVTAPLRTAAAYPLNLHTGEAQWLTGVLLTLLMGLALALTPVLVYPLLKQHNPVLALGAVVFRGVLEQVCQLLLVLSMFLLLTVSAGHQPAGAAAYQTLGAVLRAAGEWTQLIGGIVFGAGTLMFFILFYQTRLIPRWLSGWGLAGAGLYIAAHCAGVFSPQHLTPVIGEGIGLLLVPTAIQEMVFAGWLIAQGFNPTALAALTARPQEA